MFVSYFPRPRLFFPSAVLWSAFCVGFGYAFARGFGAALGFAHNGPPIIGVQMFWAPPFLWFDLYYWSGVALFSAVWRATTPHRWWIWSIVASALILFDVYILVEVNVGIVRWYGPFWDMVQDALGHTRTVGPPEFYGDVLIFLGLALFFVTLATLNNFLVSHWVFRWRTAMNQHYVDNWSRLRQVEGAGQRVQDDTMRFATTVESLGVSFVQSVMTLIAFTPVLIGLSQRITHLPLMGMVPNALLWAGLAWAAFGTGILALVGVRLPGLYFKNQRAEAAYRKELVYGEDDAARAAPATLGELFAGVRKNYFALYFNYVYFNVARNLYLQTDNVFGIVMLGPSIIAGVLTFGLVNQILGAFDQVRGSMQYLVNSWSTIVELQSIYKRLRAFEAVIYDEPLPALEHSAGVV